MGTPKNLIYLIENPTLSCHWLTLEIPWVNPSKSSLFPLIFFFLNFFFLFLKWWKLMFTFSLGGLWDKENNWEMLIVILVFGFLLTRNLSFFKWITYLSFEGFWVKVMGFGGFGIVRDGNWIHELWTFICNLW